MAAGADRLSGLCDDLLVSIISFLPTMEAGRTAVLSRRWRPLWRRTDTLNLDSRSYPIVDPDLSWLWSGTNPVTIKYKLFSTARHALDARDRRCPVTKLSLFVKGLGAEYCEDVMCDTYDLLASLLAVPALRRIEELRVEFEFEDDDEEDPHDVCHLDPASLPGDTLRVLDLPCCRLKFPPGSAGASCFPRLSVLRLYYCTSSTKHLEDLIRAMPNLTSLHVECHKFYYLGGGTDTDRLVVHSPSLTALTLVDGLGTRKGIELDTPRLRVFTYNRPLTAEFFMKSQATELAHVDLTLEWMYDKHDGQLVGLRSAPFWQFLGNFQHMKTIRLKVQNIECIAAVNHKRSVMLPALERLELDAPCSEPACRDNAATAIASFLKCCPVIHDLRIRVATDAWDYRGRLTNFVLRIRCTRELVPAALLGPDGSAAHARWGPWFLTICQPRGFFDWLPGFEWLSVLFDPRAKETNGSIESSKQRRKRKRDY